MLGGRARAESPLEVRAPSREEARRPSPLSDLRNASAKVSRLPSPGVRTRRRPRQRTLGVESPNATSCGRGTPRAALADRKLRDRGMTKRNELRQGSPTGSACGSKSNSPLLSPALKRDLNSRLSRFSTVLGGFRGGARAGSPLEEGEGAECWAGGPERNPLWRNGRGLSARRSGQSGIPSGGRGGG